MRNNSKIHALLITGFLGAGKTTLLNNLLKILTDRKIAVIENEFGEINIDKNLIINKTESIYSLENGCICCSINDKFAETLISILEFEPNTDLILVETTGVANPNNVAASFFEMQILEIIDFKATICVIDAKDFFTSVKSEEIISIQIAFADLVIINKIDLINPADIPIIKSFISSINCNTQVLTAKNCEVDINQIMEANYKEKELNFNFHLQHTDYNSVSFEISETFDRNLFLYAITSINAIYQEKLLRIKGIVYFEDNIPYSFHSIKDFGDLIALSIENYYADESLIVFIGKSLDKNIIYKELSAAFAEEENYE